MKKRSVVVILPSIRSAHNTGAFFRTADASGVDKMYLCGYTAPPPHPHLVKVSLGAEETVPWEQIEDTQEVISKLKAEGYQIVAIEKTESSVDYTTVEYSEKVAVIFGNEVHGLSEDICSSADVVTHIPMRGEKESLNVSVAGGIILYHLF